MWVLIIGKASVMGVRLETKSRSCITPGSVKKSSERIDGKAMPKSVVDFAYT